MLFEQGLRITALVRTRRDIAAGRRVRRTQLYRTGRDVMRASSAAAAAALHPS